ncbi:hypothetical protein [Raineyella sp.]|uniref:Uncharacterized protein n=1 Tax=bioreactor metagenome TaxID=1076179 RepID=A0A644WQS8_9ZZZZ|nr:hypothetical protein [Raineyella sp.]MEA5154449.1 hypothetical protein [Raineyella sp.]
MAAYFVESTRLECPETCPISLYFQFRACVKFLSRGECAHGQDFFASVELNAPRHAKATGSSPRAITTILARSYKKRTLPCDHAGQSSIVFNLVDAAGLKPNTWQRFERLRSAWNQAKLGVGDTPLVPSECELGVVRTPRRRARTPLTARELDAIRTARANGESVVSISRRFGIHRMTVWTYTKDLL